MHILSRDSLKEGGFAGLREHRIVTDSRLFGARKKVEAAEGIGNFVYLADARFNPNGETGMHPHREVDVISVMVKGRVTHEGSLAHGQNLEQGDVQVQRAGGEGFSHNEINPDDEKNRLLQLWVLPEKAGERAGYKFYSPASGGRTCIYGGSRSQSETFDSHTFIEIIHLNANETFDQAGEALVYVFAGEAEIVGIDSGIGETEIVDGDLVRGKDLQLITKTGASLVAIYI